MKSAQREIRRVRHETKQRLLTVTRVVPLTPKMVRVTFAGADLQGFATPGFDDHVKLIFPRALDSPDRAPMRDYTPRFDQDSQVLHIDFAIHDGGIATAWATQAKVGDTLLIGGPRGSAIIPMEFDWHLLIGDETALPAIGRRLEELPDAALAVVVIEVQDAAEQQPLNSKAEVRLHWVHRHGVPAGAPDGLIAAVRALESPRGDFFAWAAAESNVVRSIRRVLIEDKAANRDWVKSAGYWKRGAIATHERIED